MASLSERLREGPLALLTAAAVRARREPLTVIAALCWFAAALIARHRLPYGVSHRDEAFYSAMPYSFLLGNRPYFDELAIHQNAGLLLVPFFWVYVAINKTADGIILFNRYLYWSYLLVCSVLAFRLVRELVGNAVACCVGALVVTFAYSNILALSYNTCGALGLFCGLMCSALAMLRPRPGPLLFVGCLFFLSAVFSYPGLVFVVPPVELTVLAWLYWKLPRASLKNGLIGLGAGVGAALVSMGPLALWLGASGLHRLLAYAQSTGFATASSFAKFNFLNPENFSKQWGPALLAFAALFTALPLACWLLPRGVWLLAPLTAYAAHYCYRLGFPPANTYIAVCEMAISVLAPVCVALNRQWRYGRLLLALVWAPSCMEMAATVLTSSNAYLSMSLGALGVIVAGVTSFCALLQHLTERRPSNRLSYALVFIGSFGALLAGSIDSLYGAAYDVASFMSLHDTRVKVGPFRGALATAQEAEFLTTIDADLKGVQDRGNTLTIFDDFATGYLSTQLRPRTFTTWIYWHMESKYRHALMDATFGRVDQMPDLVLKIRPERAAQSLWPKYERNLYRPIVERPEYGYVIWQRIAEPHHRKPARH